MERPEADKSAEYRDRAQDCAQRAATSHDRDMHAEFLSLAAKWEALARAAEGDPAHEAGEPASGTGRASPPR